VTCIRCERRRFLQRVAGGRCYWQPWCSCHCRQLRTRPRAQHPSASPFRIPRRRSAPGCRRGLWLLKTSACLSHRCSPWAAAWTILGFPAGRLSFSWLARLARVKQAQRRPRQGSLRPTGSAWQAPARWTLRSTVPPWPAATPPAALSFSQAPRKPTTCFQLQQSCSDVVAVVTGRRAGSCFFCALPPNLEIGNQKNARTPSTEFKRQLKIGTAISFIQPLCATLQLQ